MFAIFKRLAKGAESPPPVFQYWDQTPPPEIVEWMTSWQAVAPKFRLQQFDQVMAREFIASHIGAEAEAAYLKCAAPAMQADFFRYCALFVHGGVYADADMQYKGELNSLYVRGRRGMLLRRTQGDAMRLTNSFMIVREPRDPLMQLAISEAMENIFAERSQSVWDVTGPGILRRAYGSERRDELFDGFEILQMHSAAVRRVIAYQKGEYKSGERDWRRMKEAGVSIFAKEQMSDHD